MRGPLEGFLSNPVTFLDLFAGAGGLSVEVLAKDCDRFEFVLTVGDAQ